MLCLNLSGIHKNMRADNGCPKHSLAEGVSHVNISCLLRNRKPLNRQLGFTAQGLAPILKYAQIKETKGWK